MARACGCDLRAILAGAIICWAVANGIAVAQEGAEVMEDVGNSYQLARRTTSLGSVIETLLFSGQAIVTEIAVPGPGAGVTAGTTGAATAARAPAGNASAARGDTGTWLTSMGTDFGGTLLTGEIVDKYFVLHRIRTSGPVTHDIYHDGHKVGSVSEVSASAGTTRLSGPNLFAFESTDDRFIVHLTQPDGTRIRATTEHGQFSGQVVERAAAVASPLRSAGKPPSQIAPMTPEPVPLPRAFPKPQLRPTIATTPVQKTSPSQPGNDNSPPPAKPKPAVASVNAPPPAAVAARPIASAPKTVPPAKPKPAVASANPPPPAAATARPVASVPKTEQPSRPKSAVADIARHSPVATAAKPIAPTSTTAMSAAKLKPTPTTANARPSQAAAAKPVTAAAKLSRSPPRGTSSQ